MKKWMYEMIALLVLLCVGLCIWWYVSTNNERKSKVEFEKFVKFAERQKVEITVLKQREELERLKQEFARKQRLATPTIAGPIERK